MTASFEWEGPIRGEIITDWEVDLAKTQKNNEMMKSTDQFKAV
jgi:hypothetical protein